MITHGQLYPSEDLPHLTQNMLEILLDNQITIDVGWYPEHDPNGKYVVTAFRDNAENLLLPVQTTKSYKQVNYFVEVLVAVLGQL